MTGVFEAAASDGPSLARRAWFLTGPTAAGKTAAALELAHRLNAEIISLDSMALYRGMDIGTAKPTEQQRLAVPHHLIDVLDPHEEFSVAEYLNAARRAVDDIESRGRKAMFVGGTPLYLKAALRGLFEGPPADWELRKSLESEAQSHEPGHLHRRLAQVDPASAAKLHANDSRRLIRALEVFIKTGRPMSAWQEQFDRPVPQDQCRVYVVERDPAELRRRIDQRVEQMFADGFTAEVARLLTRPEGLGRTASQAVGYREVIAHLQQGVDLPTTISAIQTSTHQFAKRQRTWFRSLSECRPVPLSGDPDPCSIVELILS